MSDLGVEPSGNGVEFHPCLARDKLEPEQSGAPDHVAPWARHRVPIETLLQVELNSAATEPSPATDRLRIEPSRVPVPHGALPAKPLAVRSGGFWRRIHHWRVVRRLGGLALVGSALWWLALPIAFPVARQAIVNSRIVQVRAPIDGTTTALHRDLGDRVIAGEPLMHIHNEHVDGSHYERLRTRRAELLADRTRLVNELERAKQGEAQSRQAARLYRDALVKNLEASLDEAAARAEAARAEAEGARRRLANYGRLARRQLVSAVEVDATRERATVTELVAEEAQAAFSKVEKEIEAAEHGVFLQGDGSYHQRRAHDLAADGSTSRGAGRSTAAYASFARSTRPTMNRRSPSTFPTATCGWSGSSSTSARPTVTRPSSAGTSRS